MGGRLISAKLLENAQFVNRNCTFFPFGSAKCICRVLCRWCRAGETLWLTVGCDWRSSNEASFIKIAWKLPPLKLLSQLTLACCDIATVFLGFDSTYDHIPLNARAGDPDLVGTRAALRGGLMSELIVDEPTARALLLAGHGRYI